MKNFFHRWGTSLALLCLLGSVSFAQVITSSIQLSQDPRGPFGVDINSGVYFPGHLLTPAGRPPPVLTACITGGSPAVTGTDFSGTITAGSTASTSCVVTFGTAFVTAPRCVVSYAAGGPPATSSWTTSTTALTITQASTGSAIINYICMSAS